MPPRSKKSTTAKVTVSTVVVETTSTSLKRTAGELDEPSTSTAQDTDSRPTKLVKQNSKIPDMFLPKSERLALLATYTPPPASTGPFRWLPSLALPVHQPRALPGQTVEQVGAATCLFGVHLDPKPSTKVALFDLDDTLITRKSGQKFSDDPTDWKVWSDGVVERLKRAISDGFSIIIVTNQAGLPVKDREQKWKTKIPMIAENAFKDIPFRVFAAKQKDGFRKPMLGMWDALAEQFSQENVTIDKSTSVMVGDAAGRIKPKDHSAGDRKFAENIGLRFYTPEEYFKNQKVVLPPLTGFHPSTHIKASSSSDPSPKLVSTSKSPEMVLFVGPPGCGKSTTFARHFGPAGYVHVNQDTLKTKPKCFKEVERVLGQSGKCVVDNTNRDKAARSEFIKIAKKHGARARCVYFDMPIELAWHNNLYRAFHMRAGGDGPAVVDSLTATTSTVVQEDSGEEDTKSKGKKTKKITMTKTTTTTVATTAPALRSLVPWIAYTSFRSKFEAPEANEGFEEVIKLGFEYDGDGEERERWNTWMEL